MALKRITGLKYPVYHSVYRILFSQLMIETVLIPPLGNLGYMCSCIRVHVSKDCFFEGGL